MQEQPLFGTHCISWEEKKKIFKLCFCKCLSISFSLIKKATRLNKKKKKKRKTKQNNKKNLTFKQPSSNEFTSLSSDKITIALTSWSTHSVHKSTFVSGSGACVKTNAPRLEKDYNKKDWYSLISIHFHCWRSHTIGDIIRQNCKVPVDVEFEALF